MGPQARAAAYKNRIVGAVWLSLALGGLTLVEPFVGFARSSGVAVGLLAPEVLVRTSGIAPGSGGHVLAAAVGGVALAVLGLALGFGRSRAALAAIALLVLDLPLVATFGRPGEFAFVITCVLRIAGLLVLLRGYRACGERAALLQTMAEADGAYEEERKAKAAKRGDKSDKLVDSRFEPEDDYQG